MGEFANRFAGYFGARPALLLLLVTLLAYVPGLNTTSNPNTLSRLALSLSLVEDGDIYIDELSPLTIDKAFRDGRYLSDKAPGVSFLALPAVAAGRFLVKLYNPDATWMRPAIADAHGLFRGTRALIFVTWLATITTSALFTCLAVQALFAVAQMLGAPQRAAFYAALAYGLSTPAWGWATAFFGHATAGALLIIGFWLVVRTARAQEGGKADDTAIFTGSVLAGLSLAMAVATEYPTGLAAIAIGLYGLWRVKGWPRRRLGILGAGILLGTAGPATALLAYNAAAFGTPFSLGYDHVTAFSGMQTGFFGITLPSPIIIWELLFGVFRGLIWVAPVLVLAPYALLCMRRQGRAAAAIMCAAIFIALLLVNAGYAYWWGGATIGPRHLTPALGFLALALAFSPVEGASAYARTFRILLALGIFINFAMVLTGMDGPERRGTFTLFEIVLPGLLTSHLYTLAYRHWGIPLDLTFTLYTLPLLAVPVLFAIARVNAVLAGRDAALARYRPWVLEAIEVFSGDRPKGRDPDWLVALCRARGVAIVAGICAFGFIIRAVAAMAMDGAHWPDEIYQSLEQGHRLAFGYGIVPWEFRSGARSPLIVWFTAGIMWPVEALGGGPRAYVDAVRLSLAATSLAMIYCAWRLGARLSFTHALVAAFVAAVWFEFVYFSHRPLTESIAATLLVVGLTLLSTGNGEATRRRFFAAGVALGACAAFRFHLAPALAVAAIWACWDHGTARGVPLAVGAAIMLALAGIADWIYWGAPFHSYFVNFWVNLIEGKASTFGTSRWFFYPQHAAVFWQGAIPVIVALIVFGARRYPMWLVVAVVVVATHTLIPHKEYRFVYPAVACAVMLAAIGSGDLLRAVLPHLRTRFGQVLSIICALVVWGTVSLSLANSSSFSPEWTRYRTMIRATLDLHDEDRMCGLAVPYIPWTTWAGYVHLHRDLPVYFPTTEEAVAERAPSYNFMLVNEDHSTLLPKGYTRVSCRRAGNVFNTCTYRRPSGCVYDGENDIRRLLSE